MITAEQTHHLPSKEPKKGINRRTFLKILGVLAGAAVGKKALELLPSNENTVLLGEEKPANFSANNSPDGQIAMLKSGTTYYKWVSCGPETYLYRGPQVDDFSQQEKVLSPDYTSSAEGSQQYAGLTTVFEYDGKFFGLYHQEHWASASNHFPFTAAIGLAESEDNGHSWTKRGPVLQGPDHPFPGSDGNRPFGVGQPSGIIIGEHLYVYHTGWYKDASDSIYLSRVPLGQMENPVAWERYNHESGFVVNQPDQATPLISPHLIGEEAHYCALPNVSFNTFLEKYLMIFETDTGFYLTTSEDGETWAPAEVAMAFPQPKSEVQTGEDWYSYPTFLSETNSQMETTDRGWLVFSKGQLNRAPHRAYQRELQLQKSS